MTGYSYQQHHCSPKVIVKTRRMQTEKNSPDFLIHIDEINIVVQAVTRRCSGLSSGAACRFSLLLDQPGAELWGGGLVSVAHRCLPAGAALPSDKPVLHY